MARTPVVSIVIAARNEGDNVRKTADSITEHTSTPPCELVLVDDGNTDGSFSFLETPEYRHRSDISCFRFDSPVGCVRARHQGVRLARGRYVLFLDAHMAVPDGWLDRLVHAAERAGPLAAITPNVANLDEASWTIQAPYAYYLKINKVFQFEWDRQIHHGQLLPTAGGACVLMPRDLYWSSGGFDLGLRRWGCEFVDLILKVYAIGGTCRFEPSVCVGHLFRTRFPYAVSWLDVTYNTLRVGYIHLSDRAFRRFVDGVAGTPGFDDAWQLFQENMEEIEARRRIQLRRQKRDPDWFVRTFLPELLEEAGTTSGMTTRMAPRAPLPPEHEGVPGRTAGPPPHHVSPALVPAVRLLAGDDGSRGYRVHHRQAQTSPWARARGPRVSILIPVRNEGGNLRRTIDGILASTSYPDYEILVVDDASTDGCTAFLQQKNKPGTYAAVRCVRHRTRCGYVAALNEAAELATGDVLKFLDAHQWVGPHWLTNLVDTLATWNYQALVGPVVKPLHPQTWRPAGNSSYGFGTDRDFSRFWHLGPESIGPNLTVPLLVRHQITMAKRSFVELGGLSSWYRGHGFDDFDLCLRARARGLEVVVEPTVMVAHLPKQAFINEVRWEDIVFNKLVLGHLHFGARACERMKRTLAEAPGFAGGWRAFEDIRYLLDRYPLGPPDVEGATGAGPATRAGAAAG